MWPPVPDIRAAVGVSGACRRLRLFWERTNSGPPKPPLRWSSLGKPDKELAAFPALVVTPLGQARKYKSLRASRAGHWQDCRDTALSWRCPGPHCVALVPACLGLSHHPTIPRQARHLAFSTAGSGVWRTPAVGRSCGMEGCFAAFLASVLSMLVPFSPCMVATRPPPDVLNDAGGGRNSRYLL